ncbi:DUF4235 domain-containing protein [Streptomyces sp. NPDC000229]|uniref:DUF4235 domain-containing protein n=1 Tax=Streptomyces sp. NPDC000229 TaxID=3154247 RepID=UPI004037EB69
MIAGAAFKQAWKIPGHDEDAPDATEDRSWQEVLLAPAVQGVIFAVVKAAADRAGAATVHRVSGTWPG